MKAAQPFMLIVVQIGKTNLEMRLSICKLSSAEAMVTGNVPADDLENKATIKAGSMPRATFKGFRPRISSNNGRKINICRILELITVAK